MVKTYIRNILNVHGYFHSKWSFQAYICAASQVWLIGCEIMIMECLNTTSIIMEQNSNNQYNIILVLPDMMRTNGQCGINFIQVLLLSLIWCDKTSASFLCTMCYHWFSWIFIAFIISDRSNILAKMHQSIIHCWNAMRICQRYIVIIWRLIQTIVVNDECLDTTSCDWILMTWQYHVNVRTTMKYHQSNHHVEELRAASW